MQGLKAQTAKFSGGEPVKSRASTSYGKLSLWLSVLAVGEPLTFSQPHPYILSSASSNYFMCLDVVAIPPRLCALRRHFGSIHAGIIHITTFLLIYMHPYY